MAEVVEHAIVDFYTYPPIGGDDWRYTFQTARIRGLEMHLLSKAALLDMANSDSFETAAELLTSSEYALPQDNKSFAGMEKILLSRRSEVRDLFANLIIDEPIVELFQTRQDFANLRLALRRKLTEKPI